MLFTLLISVLLFCQDPDQLGPALGARYGRILIEGNTDTPGRVILKCLQLFPGQRIQFGAVAAARQRLQVCGVFKTNPWRGEAPSIVLLPNEFDCLLWDVYIRVQERPGNWLAFGMAELLVNSVRGAIELDPDRVLRTLDWLVRRADESAR